MTESKPGRDAVGEEDSGTWCCRRMSSTKACWHKPPLVPAGYGTQEEYVTCSWTFTSSLSSLFISSLAFACCTSDSTIFVCTPCVFVVMPSTLIQHKILNQNCIHSRHAHTPKNRSQPRSSDFCVNCTVWLEAAMDVALSFSLKNFFVSSTPKLECEHRFLQRSSMTSLLILRGELLP